MMENLTVTTTLTLSGLNFPFVHRIIIFVLILLCYLLILLNNFTIIFVVINDKKLHKPMYIFLCNLCVNALYGSVGFFPKFLVDLVSSHVISYAGCMLQGYVIHSSNCCDFSILLLMAYDRYVALCRPLVYQSLMTKQRISVLVFFSWLVPLFCMFMNSASLLGKKLCGFHINKLYCVNLMVANLLCSPPKVNNIIAMFNIGLYFVHFLLVCYSYVYLIKMCLASAQMWKKFRQTCTPHFICLLVYATTLLLDLLYMRFGSADLSIHLKNFMTIEFLIIPPILNPLIYGVQLTHIRNSILSYFLSKKKVQSF
ncbi:olfactory receptor 49-like [Corythoichthys intestinalis]|uniref:olfactory receptor 49-like n=1 Tax=Corythoichthys intestinalis TaxID=161448 RepID=UPI0025A6539D|nr:olfactory receptor 49-like [Corythoichthys intestinalis]XP_061799388.1 olfactory receptor 6E1-like [Nerophis lumbriciformis]